MSMLHGSRRLLPPYALAAAFEPRSRSRQDRRSRWRLEAAIAQALVILLGLAVIMPAAGAAEQPELPLEAKHPTADTVTFDVLTYNTFLLPVLPDSQSVRAPLMADHLKGYDVVLLQEAYSNRHRDMVLRGLADDYPYRSQVLGRDRWLKQDGGTIILSKWPIEAESERLFGPLCQSRDCWADKGVLYARINKLGRRFHVFATHLQSGRAGRATRERQMAIIRDMVEELSLPEDEPVLIGGDLNTDRFTDDLTGAFTRMTRILQARHPRPPPGHGHEPTRSGGYIDYVLYEQNHLQPIEAFNVVRRIVTDGRPLSDHSAVHGRFVFESVPETAQAGESERANALN